MESTGNSSSQTSAMPALSDGSSHAVSTRNGPEDSYAASASSSSQLADAEARFQAAKSRLLSLIRTSVDKVASGQYDSNTDSTQGNVNVSHANDISATYSSSGALSPSSGRPGDRGRAEGHAGALSKQPSASGRGLYNWEQDKDLVSSMPLMQPVKPKSRQSVGRSGSARAGMLGTSAVGAQGGGGAAQGGPASPGRTPFEISPSKVAKAAAHQKDFDLRLGPAYNLEMERMRRRLMTEERRKREEASASMARMVQQRQEQQQKEEHGGPRSAEGAHAQDGRMTASGRPSTMGTTSRAGTGHRSAKPSTAGGRRPGRPTNSARPARGGDPGSSEKDAVYGPGSRQGSLILPPVSAGLGVGGDLPAGHSMMMASTNGQVIPASAAINVNGVQMAGYVPAPSSSSYGPYGGMYAPMPPAGPYGQAGVAGGGLGGGPSVMFGAYIMTPMGPMPAQYAAAYAGGGPSSAALSPRDPSPTPAGGPLSTQQQQQPQPQGPPGSSGSVLMNGSMYGSAQQGGAYYSYPSMQAAPYYSYPAASASQLQLPADAHPHPHAHPYPQHQQLHSPNGPSSASHPQPAHSNGRAATAGKAHKGEAVVSSPYGKVKPQMARGSSTSSQGRGKSRGSAQKPGRGGEGSPAGAGGATEGFHGPSGPSGTSPTAGPAPMAMGGPVGMGMSMGMPLYFSAYPSQQQQQPSTGSGAAMSVSYASSSSLLSQYGIGSGGAAAVGPAGVGAGAQGTVSNGSEGAGGQGIEEALPEMLAGEIEVEEDEGEGE